jgi:hypothetical protein
VISTPSEPLYFVLEGFLRCAPGWCLNYSSQSGESKTRSGLDTQKAQFPLGSQTGAGK